MPDVVTSVVGMWCHHLGLILWFQLQQTRKPRAVQHINLEISGHFYGREKSFLRNYVQLISKQWHTGPVATGV